MANKVLNFIIKAKDSASETLRGVFTNLANIKAGLDILKSAAAMVADGIKRLWSTVVEAMKYETLEKKFSMLLMDAQRAKDLVKTMQELGETPPFGRDEFAAAAQALVKLGAGALATKEGLAMLGDAAYATGAGVADVANNVAFAYASIKEGKPIGRYGIMLERAGLIQRGFADELARMQEEGKSSIDIWAAMQAQISRYSGAMDSALETGEGLMTAIGGKWQTMIKDFGAAFLDLAKNELAYFLDKLTQLQKSGAVERWAERVRGALQPVVEAFGNLFDGDARSLTVEATGDRLKGVLEWALSRLSALIQYGADLISIGIRKAIYGGDRSDDAAAARQLFDARNMFADSRYRYTSEAAAQKLAAATEARRKNAEQARAAAEERAAAKEVERRKREAAESERVANELAAVDKRRAAEAYRRNIEAGNIRERMAREQMNLDTMPAMRNDLQAQASYWGGVEREAARRVEEFNRKQNLTFADLDARMAAQKDAKKRAREEAKYGRLVQSAKDALERDGLKNFDKWSADELQSKDAFKRLSRKQREALLIEAERRDAMRKAEADRQQAKMQRDRMMQALDDQKKVEQEIRDALKDENDALNKLLALK